MSLTGGCASDKPPSGGPVDRSPLQVISSDPAHTATGFSGKSIRLAFSHPVSGREFLGALGISPALGNYDVAVNGREAEIRIFEPLKPETTYRIILNRHMRDMRGNRLGKTAVIAFSTGAATDAGSIEGTVYAYNLAPASDALLIAFREDGNADKPDYLVQADNDGIFRLDNLAGGDYRVIAVNDRNHNLRFDRETESVAVAHKARITTGTAPLRLRFPPGTDTTPMQTITEQAKPTDKNGTLSGSCKSDADALTIEARRKSDDASFLAAAVKTAKGFFIYTFKSIPPGTYTVSASVPSDRKQGAIPEPWKPGKLEPFTPSEPFAVYPDTVRIRPGWLTDGIDLMLRP